MRTPRILLPWMALCVAAAAHAAAHAADDACPPGSLPLPTDAQLEASGARVGGIFIERREIFDLSDPAENNWLFRLADHLHVRTRDSAIRAQLLFAPGDRYSRALLDESERNMRDNSSFLREPRIRPVCYHDGVVDIRVLTHDTWTLQPGIDYGRSGGKNSTGFDFADANFLGFGKYVDVGHTQDVDRTTNFISWADPNVWGSRWQDGLQYSENSDGRSWLVQFKHPFFSLETPRAGGFSVGEDRLVVRRYSLGNPYDAYLNDARTDDADVGLAFLVTPEWTGRWQAGWHVDRNVFEPAAGETLLGPLPANRLLSYPYARLEWIRNRYATMRNLDLIARTEDVHFGLDAQFGAGYASPVYGADRRSLLLDAEVGYGLRFRAADVLQFDSRAASRFENGLARDTVISGTVSYYISTGEHTRLFMRLSGNAGHRLDLDHYFELGGDTGLRGYPLRYQNGSQEALFTLEQRLYTNWFLFRLLNVGAAAFFDMGRTWGYSPVPTPQLGLLKDAGVGLRLGNWRSSFGSVIHVDFAAPLDRTPEIRALQFLVTTEQSF